MSGRLCVTALILAVLATPASGQTDEIVRDTSHLVAPDWYFREAIERRADPTAARQAIMTAEEDYDGLWRYGRRTPALAVNRGRSHYLAGRRAQAIQAFHDGLAVYPWDRDLQHGLTVARAAVRYPAEADPAQRIRPDPPAGLRYRLSPALLLLVSVACSLLLAVGLAARFTSRPNWAVPAAVVGLLGIAAVGAAWWQIDREVAADREHPVLVLHHDTPLRTGNGNSYPLRLDAPLPLGAEVRRLHARGGWVQVETAGGAVGWLPENAVLASGGV